MFNNEEFNKEMANKLRSVNLKPLPSVSQPELNDLEFYKATLNLEGIASEFYKYVEIAKKRNEQDKVDRFFELAKAANNLVLFISTTYWGNKSYKEQIIELSSFYTNLLDKNKKLIIENEELKAMNERLINSKL